MKLRTASPISVAMRIALAGSTLFGAAACNTESNYHLADGSPVDTATTVP